MLHVVELMKEVGENSFLGLVDIFGVTLVTSYDLN